MPRELGELLVLAHSTLWSDRALAATELADVRSDAGDAALRRLLQDPDDTAVAESALDALVRRGDEKAASLVFEAVATSDDDLGDHLLYFLAVREASLRSSGFVELTRAALEANNDDVQSGASEVMRHLGWR